MLIGGIEGGGTKFVCAVGDGTGEILQKVSIPTRDPEDTLKDVKEFFNNYPIEALGIGSFGPVDLERDSNSYGMILNTPKIKWKGFPLLKQLKSDYEIPVFIDTDVNTACLGEYMYGVGKNVESCLYVTVGTGIGAGFVQQGKVYQGKNHSEMGHILVRQHSEDPFEGNCPYHGSCLEGLASGPSIEARYGKKGAMLSDNNKVWESMSYYLAQALINYTMILSPERIIVGGGVMKQENLLGLIREQFVEMLNEYVAIPDVSEFIVTPKLEDEQGVKGAIRLAVSGLERI